MPLEKEKPPLLEFGLKKGRMDFLLINILSRNISPVRHLE